MLRALARQIAGSQAETTQAQAAADWDHDDAQAVRQHPPSPLRGYQVAEITITENSPAADRKLADVSWPPASIPVSGLRGRRLRAADGDFTLSAGDRVSLLVPAPPKPTPGHPDAILGDRSASGR